MQAVDLDESYRYCEKTTKERAKNFYYGIRLLPPEQRRSMCAMYAFFRYCDDVSDGEVQGSKADLLKQWRQAIDGDQPGHSKILPAFYDAKRKHAIPSEYFHAMIDGVEADLSKNRYATFDELYRYCYCVASTVGLVCVHVYGFDHSPEALQMAEWRGIAFQLTNILRDVAEDLSLSRIYLPQDELAGAGLSEADLLAGRDTPAMRQFLKEQVARAQDYYGRAARLEERVDPACRSSLAAMTSIYQALLTKVGQMGCTVLKKRAKLSTVEKLRLAGKTLLGKS
ncbi:MAG: phytoene/squalene synthase family protein [Candidatus Eremiobacteraeota bacterium]|nr:phytoene/squalene synthase family protein [Candidatus Eremiobacteraeota bacterium]MCW5870297.1 phytoene/squalene synthase family protein [Candidatus Eremiobacteraeota bacterium]